MLSCKSRQISFPCATMRVPSAGSSGRGGVEGEYGPPPGQITTNPQRRSLTPSAVAPDPSDVRTER